MTWPDALSLVTAGMVLVLLLDGPARRARSWWTLRRKARAILRKHRARVNRAIEQGLCGMQLAGCVCRRPAGHTDGGHVCGNPECRACWSVGDDGAEIPHSLPGPIGVMLHLVGQAPSEDDLKRWESDVSWEQL